MQIRPSRVLFVATILWGASIFWLAPRPPMTDLPQHAGQVTLLQDLLAGTSPWSSIFRINLFTPYLVGYGLTLPLSYLMPVGIALKVILSLAYLGFVLSLIALRRHFGGDARLDWLFILSFFGPAYAWGFLTFLTAAPVAVVFMLVADRYALRPSFKRGLWVAAVGIALLLSHGLMYVFGLVVAGAIYTVRSWHGRQGLGRWLMQAWPFMVSAVACLAYFLISKTIEQQYGGIGNVGPTLWQFEWKRLPKIFINSLGGKADLPLVVVSVILPLVPWLLGLRIDRRRPVTWVLFGITLLVSLAVPMFAMATGILYLRFALFTLPAYALLFASRGLAPHDGPDAKPSPRARWAMPLMMGATWMMLGIHSWHALRFASESHDFEAVLAAMAPGQRALWIPLDRTSEAAQNPYAYLHYGSWYQSEKQGLVDFNFAWFPPQVARFRPDQLPAVTYGFEHHPTEFDWKKHHGEQYRYFVIRHDEPLPSTLFSGADCLPGRILDQGEWTLFERRDCAGQSVARHAAP